MDKQTKQLVILVVLVVVAGLVAAWQFGVFGGDGETPPAAANNAAPITTPAAPGNTGPKPAGPQPAGPQPAAGGPQTPGAKPETQIEDKEIPPDTKPQEITYAWPWDPVPENPPEDYVKPYDPLFVMNIDVVDPERKEYIENLKKEWVLEGISETWQEVRIVDEAGNEIGRERMLVKEAWFKDKRRPYKEKDRLTNTRFQIKEIFIDPSTGSSGVILLGDTGAVVTMYLAPADRYGE